MNPFNLLACMLLTVGSVAASGDRHPTEGRVIAGPGAPTSRSALGSALPPFVTFGWIGPPIDSTSAARVAQMRDAGFNLLLPAIDDSGSRTANLARLDWAESFGLKCIVWDRRFDGPDPGTPAGAAAIDSIVADYRAHPAFFGYYFDDEPEPALFPRLDTLYTELRARDPEHPAWDNLYGRGRFATRTEWEDYVRAFVARTHPAVLCDDQYDFTLHGDRGQFVENAAGLAALARSLGLPFWGTLQLIQHGPYRALTVGELSWQAAMLLAYGARGLGVFTYWTPPADPRWNWQPAMIDTAGRETHWYGAVAALAAKARPVGEALAGLTWLATVHAGSVPVGGTRFAPDDLVRAVAGRAALGHFVDRSGVRYLLVANSDSAAARRITLTLRPHTRIAMLGEGDPPWPDDSLVVANGVFPLALDAGGFALLRLGGSDASVIEGGAPPGITLAPNPGRAAVQLGLSRVGLRGSVEILDASGRRVWSRPLDPGSATLTWRGERDGGGRAPAGLYFVRAEDRRGVAVARLEWLGR